LHQAGVLIYHCMMHGNVKLKFPDKEVQIKKHYCLCRRLHWNRYDCNVISPDCLAL